MAGSDKQIQFNNNGSTGASSNLVWDNTNTRLGIGTSTPSSSLDLIGTLGYRRTAIGSSTNSGNQIILGVTTTASPRIITLRTADMVSGRIYIIKDESGGAGTNNITIQTEGTEKIDGQDTYVITTNYGYATLYSSGANWFIFGK